ncbi:hypothetical protein LI291_12985 [Intestinibacillus massiliensis]|nr:hypothetical protein [Intestinibacillus massiliensis]
MAKIVKYEYDPNGQVKDATVTECVYKVSETASGKIAAFTTVGSGARKAVGKGSQTLHFDRDSAQQMIHILREIFDLK